MSENLKKLVDDDVSQTIVSFAKREYTREELGLSGSTHTLLCYLIKELRDKKVID